MRLLSQHEPNPLQHIDRHSRSLLKHNPDIFVCREKALTVCVNLIPLVWRNRAHAIENGFMIFALIPLLAENDCLASYVDQKEWMPTLSRNHSSRNLLDAVQCKNPDNAILRAWDLHHLFCTALDKNSCFSINSRDSYNYQMLFIWPKTRYITISAAQIRRQWIWSWQRILIGLEHASPSFLHFSLFLLFSR
jgi:hypothetical protein